MAEDGRPPPAWGPVGLVAAGVVALLLATAGRPGYHRDELYFRLLGDHPAWGYVDQPPLVPLAGRLATALFGDHLVALRLPSIGMAVVLVALLALLARELGGGTAAQTLAAFGGASGFPLLNGHLLATGSFDVPCWVAACWLITRALLRGDRTAWLGAGVVIGIALYAKGLIVLLLIGLAAGLLLTGPRRVLATPWPWAGLATAVLIGLPNLVYQLRNGLPQVQMARALGAEHGELYRLVLVPGQLIVLGPPLLVIWLIGAAAPFRRPDWRPLRALVAGYLAIMVLLMATGGRIDYPAGLVLAIYGFGAVEVAGRIAAGRMPWRSVVGPVGTNVALSALVALPLLPVRWLAGPVARPITEVNVSLRDSVGWPDYAAQVATAYRTVPPADRARTVLLTGDYGEAAALDRFGPAHGLPTAYSGHNELWHLRRPPDGTSSAVVVMQDEGADAFLAGVFRECRRAGTLDDGLGIGAEQGVPVRVCTGPTDTWDRLWPRFRRVG